jgi:tetratricopeptide (TPR) repeat protein
MNPPPSEHAAPELQQEPAKRRRRARSRSSKRRRLSSGRTSALLIAVLAISGLGIGGLLTPVLVLCAGLAVLSALLVLRNGTEQPRLFVPALVPLALSVYTLFQLLPLPMSVLAAIAPHNARVWAAALEPFGEGAPAWGTLTADRGATLIEALKWLTYSAVLVTAIAVGARRGVGWGARAVFLVSVVVASVTFVHGLIGAHRVYGLYEPTFNAARWRVGPLLNPNNLAGYLNVGLLCGMGSMISRRPELPRVALGLGVATLLGVVFLSGSRAGVVASVCGIALLAMAARGIHRSSGGSRRDTLLLASMIGVAAGAGVLAWLGSTRDSTNALLDKNIEKIQVLSYVKPLIRDHAFFGVGRGAFESVFPAYHVGPGNGVYAHAENFMVQWVADWGLPVGVAAIATFLWALNPRRLGANRSVTAAGMWAGLVALALQNLLDLGLEIPAIAIQLAACVGIAWGAARANGEQEATSSEVSPWIGRFASAVALMAVILAAGVLVKSRYSVGYDRARVRGAVLAANLRNADDVAVVRDELHAAIQRHPAEPYFPRIGGLIAWTSGKGNPIPWIQRALERGPTIGSTHLEIGRILAQRGARNQAFFELRLATTYHPDLMRRTAPLVAKTAGDLDDVLRATPEGMLGTRMLIQVAVHRRPEFPGDLRESCLLEAIRRAPEVVEPRMIMARDLVASIAGRLAGSKCEGERRADCVKFVEQQIVNLAKVHGDKSQGMLLMSELWLALGRAAEVERMLSEQCSRLEPNLRDRCAHLRIQAAAATGSSELVANAVGELAANGCAAGAKCGAVFSSLGRELERVGRWAEALSYYRRAVTEDASDSRWADVARAANALGDFRLAADAVSRLSNRHPADAELRDRRLAAERRLLPAVLSREPARR